MTTNILPNYRTNATMRERYFRMNGITHAEIWDSEDDEGYQLVLCSADNVGYRESPVFYTIGQCVAWLRNDCNCKELDIREANNGQS